MPPQDPGVGREREGIKVAKEAKVEGPTPGRERGLFRRFRGCRYKEVQFPLAKRVTHVFPP